jgi:hypothetical protein
MTFDCSTTEALTSIGVNQAKAANGVVFTANGRSYKVLSFICQQGDIKMFRVLRDGKPVLLAQEQMRTIFA